MIKNLSEKAEQIANELETMHCGHEKEVWETFSGNVKIRDKIKLRIIELFSELEIENKKG